MIPIIYVQHLAPVVDTLRESFRVPGLQQDVAHLIAAYLLQYCYMQLMTFIATSSLKWSLPVIATEIKMYVMKQVTAIDIKYLQKQSAGSVQTQALRLIRSLVQIIETIFTTWSTIATDILVTIIMLFVSGHPIQHISLLLGWFAMMILIICVFAYSNYRFNAETEKFKQYEAQCIGEYMSNILLAKTGSNNHNLHSVARNTEHAYGNGLIVTGTSKFFLGLINILFFIGCIYMGNKMYAASNTQMRMQFFTCCASLARCFWALGMTVSASFSIVGELISALSVLEAPKQKVVHGTELKLISNISASNYDMYNDDVLVRSNINFFWHKPGIVCVTGPNGSGKTTLLMTLTGLYSNPYCNNLSINGISINHYSTSSLNANFIFVVQKDCTYNDSIKRNIVMYNQYDEDILQTTLQMTGMDRIVQKNDWSLEFVCGTQGALLSGGENKILSLARMTYAALLYPHKAIIIDEPMNHLDVVKQNEYVLPLIMNLSKTRMVICTDHLNVLLPYSAYQLAL
jgi:ABC-type bacteriocin/lantibiotic exporter with double-glycine peptidase domain